MWRYVGRVCGSDKTGTFFGMARPPTELSNLKA